MLRNPGVLRAVFLTLVAADAVPGLGMGLGKVKIVDHLGGYIAMLEQGEILWDEDMLGTLHRAVAVSCAWDRELLLNELSGLCSERYLFLIHGAEVPHGSDVILHLLHAVHTGEYHHYFLMAGGKAQHPAGLRGLRSIGMDELSYLHRELSKGIAFDRLHNDNGLAVLFHHLITFSGLDTIIVPVQRAAPPRSPNGQSESHPTILPYHGKICRCGEFFPLPFSAEQKKNCPILVKPCDSSLIVQQMISKISAA